MMARSLLTDAQKDLIGEYYSLPLRQVAMDKKERNSLWSDFKTSRRATGILADPGVPAALRAEVDRALDSGNNVQSAIMSECVYADALARHLGLFEFWDVRADKGLLDQALRDRLQARGIAPRYVYSAPNNSRVLVQAGGFGGVDAVLVSGRGEFLSIEFKEPAAKTSEPDLPKYGEDGDACLTPAWSTKNPQFVPMMNEQLAQGLNFFKVAGSNVHTFSEESVLHAVSENYTGEKLADVICTEDVNGVLTMIPSNQVAAWATLKGEVRPAGRNAYAVWTMGHLLKTMEAMGDVDARGIARVPVSALTQAGPRGGTGISRYKISPLFFVRAGRVRIQGGTAAFRIEHVQQLNPTISAHMFFKTLRAQQVKEYYIGGD